MSSLLKIQDGTSSSLSFTQWWQEADQILQVVLVPSNNQPADNHKNIRAQPVVIIGVQMT